KWAEANNAAAQQHQQSTLGASTAAPTQHAAIDSEAVISENLTSQGVIEGDIDHAPAQQQMGPSIASTDSLARATDGSHENGEGEDDQLTSHYWIEQRYNNHGPPDSEYAATAERMFRVLLNERLVDAMDNSDHVNKLSQLVEMPDYDIDYINLPDELANKEYDPEAPTYGDAQVPAEDQFHMVAPAHRHAQNYADDGDYSDANSEALTVDTVIVPSDGKDEQGWVPVRQPE
ncbi:hypothetical protein GGI16_006782, partial [Coemansia sp. S142-1]